MATRFSFEAIGTRWLIEVNDLESSQGAGLEQAIRQRIDRFDRHYSRFRADSLVSQMAQVAGTYELPEDAAPLFVLYYQTYKASQGKVTPLIGNVMEGAGYDAQYSLRPTSIEAPPLWEEALDYAYPVLTVKQPVLLDVGAAGKGYLVDIICQLILDAGYAHFSVNAGGDIRTIGLEISVGLEHPENVEQVIGVATLQQGSICGSAGNRRRWAGYHHIIDPHSLSSPEEILAVWTVAPTAMVADMLSTYLFLSDDNVFATAHGVEWVRLYQDYSIQKSAHFPATLFTAP